MPPIRTPKQSKSRNASLFAFGFVKVDKDATKIAPGGRLTPPPSSPPQKSPQPPASLSKPASSPPPPIQTTSQVSAQTAASPTQPAPTSAPTQVPCEVPSAPVVPAKAPNFRKPVGRGTPHAEFCNEKLNWDGKYWKVIGTTTKVISFGSGLKLTDEHIAQLVALGPSVCRNLTQFLFTYSDVDYDAHNDATGVTDAGLSALAKACPRLSKIQLQGTRELGDPSLRAIFQWCQDLTSLEISGTSGSQPMFSDAALNALREAPAALPRLKTLRLTETTDRAFMKAMRDLGKARPKLTIDLVSTSEYKKWDSWYLRVSRDTYKKGRKAKFDLGRPRAEDFDDAFGYGYF
ncbi:putative F-box domain-containing protein [Seiridium cardinale]